MAETAWNRGGAQQPAPQPPAPAAGAALPPGVIRSRHELEKLRDDALASQPLQPVDVRMMWCSPAGVASALEAIIHTTRWLLGEREWTPISRELHDYPDLPVQRVVGHAKAVIFEERWPEVSEWYAGGAKRTVEWATDAGAERPIHD